MKLKGKARWAAAGLALLGLLAAVSAAQGFRNATRGGGLGSGDFLWVPAKAFTQGVNPYQFDRHDTVYYPLVYPPACLIPLVPYTLVGRALANGLWAATNLALTALALLLIRRLWLAEASPGACLLFSFTVLCSEAWRGGFGNGNYCVAALCCFIFACSAARDGRRRLAGLLLGLAWIKYTLTLPLSLLFLRRRDGRTLLWAALCQAALTALCALRLATSPLALLAACLRHAAYLSHGAYGASDFSSVVHAWLGPGHDLLAYIPALGLMALCCAAALRPDRDGDGEGDLALLAVLACASLACVYHMDYDYLALLFPLLYVFRRGALDEAGRFVVPAVLYFWFVMRLQYCAWAGPGLVKGLNAAGLPLLLGLIAVFWGRSRTGTATASKPGKLAGQTSAD